MKTIIKIAIFVFYINSLHAATIEVSNSDDSGVGSLRQAVLDASPGDTITFNSSTNGNPLTFLTGIDIQKKLTIIGNDSTNTILNGGGTSNFFSLDDTLYMYNIRLTNGSYSNGNVFMMGSGHFEATACEFDHNASQSAGVIQCNFGTNCLLNDCLFYGNMATSNGPYAAGAILVIGGTGNDFFINNCSFINNNRTEVGPSLCAGGAIYGYAGNFHITNCLFEGNSATASTTQYSNGGAVFLRGYNTNILNVEISNTEFNNNSVSGNSGSPTKGGGLHFEKAITASVVNSNFTNNSVENLSGASNGGGIYADGDLVEIEQCTFGNNSIIGNHSSAATGGGLYTNVAHVTINSCSFYDNQVTNSVGGAQGAGIFAAASVDSIFVTNSTCYNNYAQGTSRSEGGGLYFSNLVSVLRNNTIVNNTVTGGSTSAGGGVYSGTWDWVFWYNNIIANNSSDLTGADVQMNSNVNTPTFVQNLVESSNGGISWAYSSDPGLDPSGIQDNGGPVPTVAIVNVGSEAIDNSNPSFAPIYDQRGAERVNTADIGAFEFGGCFDTYSEIDLTECEMYISPSGNYTWTSPGQYFDTLYNGNATGCDSLITINLSIVNNTFATISLDGCDSIVSPSGNYTWSSTNTYQDTLFGGNSIGCDSIITANVTIRSSSYNSISLTGCDSIVSPSGNYIWYTSNTYSDTLVGANSQGCDSVLSVNATINNSTSSLISMTECDSFVSPSGLYTWTASGIYNDTLQGANNVGCDSIITIDLTILQSSASTINRTVCDSMVSPSGLYAWVMSGTYQDTLFGGNSMSCDSIITVNLTVQKPEATIDQGSFLTICKDDDVTLTTPSIADVTFDWYYNGDVNVWDTVNLVDAIANFQSSTFLSHQNEIYHGFRYYNGVNSAVTVMKNNGNSWSVVGGGDVLDYFVGDLTLAVIDDSLYLAYSDVNFKATVLKFTGTNWDTVGSPEFTSGTILGGSLCLTEGLIGQPVIAYTESDNSSVLNVMEFSGGVWQDLGVNPISVGAGYNPKIMKNSNKLYAYFTDAGLNTSGVVMYYDGAWKYLSDSIPADNKYAGAIDFYQGQPIVTYLSSDSISVKYYDGSSWLTMGQQNEVGVSAGGLNLESINDEIFVSYIDDEASDKIQVKTFNGTAWEKYGYTAEAISENNIYGTELFEHNSAPHLYYFDSGNNFLVQTPSNNSLITTGVTMDDSPTEDIGYRLVATDINNCSDTAYFDVALNLINPIISQSGQDLLVTPINLDYQWINCNGSLEIVGEIDQTFTPATSGAYSVEVTDNGCTETTECFNYNVLSLDDELKVGVYVYPNPTKGSFNLRFDTKLEDTVVSIRNGLGQEVGLYNLDGAIETNINLKGAAGVYYCLIKSRNGNAQIRIIKE